MAELCLICGKRMYIGEAYRISTVHDGSLVGYVHRTCLDEKFPKVLKQEVF
jgi:hypothetical protein